MATDINNCVFTGRVGADPEVKEVGGGTELGKFPLAVSIYKGKDRDPETMWLDIQVWGNRVAVCQYITKGMQLTVIGSLNVRTYDKKDCDCKGVGVAIDADSIVLPPKSDGDSGGGRSSSRSGGERGGGRGSSDRGSSRGSSRGSGSARSSARTTPKDEDDLPF